MLSCRGAACLLLLLFLFSCVPLTDYFVIFAFLTLIFPQ